MEIKTFYSSKNTLTEFDGVAYTSRGRLCDYIRSEFGAKHVQEEIASIRQHTLIVSDGESIDDDDFSSCTIYGYRSFSDSTPVEKWYLKAEAAKVAYDKDEEGTTVIARLYLGHLSGSRTGEYPYEAFFTRNSKGLFCRLNIDPEYEGNSTDGKLCFPDKSWRVTREGRYHVEIVRDMGSYAFVRGKSDDYSFDELNLVLDHLWAKGVPLNTYVQKVSGSMFGTFYTYATAKSWEATACERDICAKSLRYHRDDADYRRTLEKDLNRLNEDIRNRYTDTPTLTELDIIFQKTIFKKDGDGAPSVYEMPNVDISYEQKQEMLEHVEWKKSLADLFIEGAYGDIHSKDELYALFTKSGYLCERVGGKTIGPRNGKKVKGYWFRDDISNSDPDVVVDAFDAGILSAYTLEGIRAISINEDSVKEILEFRRDELEYIAEYVREVNEQADADIDTKLARGKLKLE